MRHYLFNQALRRCLGLLLIAALFISSLAPSASAISQLRSDNNQRPVLFSNEDNRNDWQALRWTAPGAARRVEGVRGATEINRSIRNAANGDIIRNVYDGDGNLVCVITNSQVVSYVLDDQNPTGYTQVLEEVTGPTNTLLRTYTYGHALLAQDQKDATTGTWTATWYGYDGHGNVRFLTDQTGQITDRYTYDAFGVVLTTSGTTPNSYKYCGERYVDSLGLYNLRARMMNPMTGRFWTMDTYEGSSSDPSSLHKYLYCNADGVNRMDPSGKSDLTTLGVAQAIGARVITLMTVYPRITLGIKLATTIISLSAFIADEQFRDELVGSLGPTAMANILAYDARFVYNTGANVLGGTFNVATEAARQGFRIIFRDPKEIKYLQEGISPTFRNNRGSVAALIDALKSGSINPNSVEPIRVFKGSDGRTMTLDHRRLYAYKEAGINIPTVEVAPETVVDEIFRKTDVGADGESIILRSSNN